MPCHFYNVFLQIASRILLSNSSNTFWNCHFHATCWSYLSVECWVHMPLNVKIHCKSGMACRLCSPKTQLYHKHFQKTECQKKNQTVIVTNPIEECNLVPSKRCVHVAKMVPKLRVTTMCVDVPREVCTKSQIKPKKVKKPSIKKWCYTPDADN